MKSFFQYLTETTKEDRIQHFLEYAKEYLGLERLPEITILDDRNKAKESMSFGCYMPGQHRLTVNSGGRHIADVLRTLAHELVHYKQDIEQRLYSGAGETGSNIENEANAEAAVMMRNYGRGHSELFLENTLMESVMSDDHSRRMKV